MSAGSRSPDPAAVDRPDQPAPQPPAARITGGV